MIREYDEGDRDAVAKLMDSFGDEIAAMDPYRRVIRAPGMGVRAVAMMQESASRHSGLVIVAEEDGRIVGVCLRRGSPTR